MSQIQDKFAADLEDCNKRFEVNWEAAWTFPDGISEFMLAQGQLRCLIYQSFAIPASYLEPVPFAISPDPAE